MVSLFFHALTQKTHNVVCIMFTQKKKKLMLKMIDDIFINYDIFFNVYSF